MKFSLKIAVFFVSTAVVLVGGPSVNFNFQSAALRAQTQTDQPDAEPPFSATVDTVFDIIQKNDPSVFTCLQYMGRGDRQIWDKRVDNEPVVNAFLFMSRYSDGANIEIAINPEFETKEDARQEAMRYANPLGQLPTVLRQGIQRFSVHKGSEGFHAGTGQIVAYAATTDKRLNDDHLEETIFHESVHASWDAEHRLSAGWIAAQNSDNRFLTSYGQESPEREDLAETALFAYAILHQPTRFPPVDTTDMQQAVPGRIEYIKRLLPPGSPLIFDFQEALECAADAQ